MDFKNQFCKDLKSLMEIMEADTPSFKAPGKEKEERPEWQKDLDKDTIMNDCDAIDCRFWNEGFKSNCMLYSVELDPQHGCKQYQKRESNNNKDV